MSVLKRALYCVPLAGAMALGACGGGSGASDTPANQQSQSGIAVGEPPPTAALVVTPFVARAQQAECATESNRLFTIDNKYVFWTRVGNCPDNSFSSQLFGVTPDLKICSVSDSIAGPQTQCADEKMRSLFDTMVANNAKARLGLGEDHVVQEISFLAPGGNSVNFRTAAADTFSGVTTARNIVVRDEAAFDALWAEHSAIRIPPPPKPVVDFDREMVLALFAGNSSACGSFGVRRVTVGADRLVVRYERGEAPPGTMCIAVVADPMQMIVVPRVNVLIDFVQITTQPVAFSDVERQDYSRITTTRNVVIKDAATFAAVWEEHAGSGSPAPAVDFSKDMLVAVFGGGGSNGCYSSRIESIYRDGGKIHVDSVRWSPKPQAEPVTACTMAITFPAHIVKLPRSDDTVEFSIQSRQR